MELIELKNNVLDFAIRCGMKPRNPRESEESNRICSSEIHNLNGNTVIRDNTQAKEDEKAALYFGFVRAEEKVNNPYRDFSLVFFPKIQDKDKKTVECCVVALGIGSEGFENDIRIASLPGTRRFFTKLRDSNRSTFFKNDFSDTNNPSDDLFAKLDELSFSIDKYEHVLPASEIVNFNGNNEDASIKMLQQWIAAYARFRDWPSNKQERTKVENTLEKIASSSKNLSADEIFSILKKDRFIVLQGAPGTGKTHTALEIAEKEFANKFDKKNVIFEQFHAETTYSDFIWGIRPKLNGTGLGYEEHKGTLLKAIERAKEVKKLNQDVLLIIDEINRANLSNVLGPVFYLFEKNSENRNVDINIGKETIDFLPDNLFVIATMNTADRSLAVVDFALRRRFTWLTLRPKVIKFKPTDNKKFNQDAFNRINDIFQKYATDDELNLQPGHSYFITQVSDPNASNEAKEDESKTEMKHRLQYELLPLIKEYLNEGYLREARDEFSNYFYEELGLNMYE